MTAGLSVNEEDTHYWLSGMNGKLHLWPAFQSPVESAITESSGSLRWLDRLSCQRRFLGEAAAFFACTAMTCCTGMLPGR
jgi:hypothetical protein